MRRQGNGRTLVHNYNEYWRATSEPSKSHIWNHEPNEVSPVPGTKKNKLKILNFRTWDPDNKDWTNMMPMNQVFQIINDSERITRNITSDPLSSQYAYILRAFDNIFAKDLQPDKDEMKYHAYRIALKQRPTPPAFAIGILSTMQEYSMQHKIEDKGDLYALTAYRGARG